MAQTPREARRRERKLLELWEEFERTQEEPRPLWPPALLEIAKRVGKGAAEIAIPRRPDEMQFAYAGRIRRMQARYPVVCFVPADRYAFEIGDEALRVFESVETNVDASIVVDSPAEQIEAWRVAHQILVDAGLELAPENFQHLLSPTRSKPSQESAITPAEKRPGAKAPSTAADTKASRARTQPSRSAGTLHGAMTAYREAIEKEFFRPELGHITQWGQTQLRQINTLIDHVSDRPLADLDADGVDDVIGYWRRRPLRKNTQQPIKAKSASNYISVLRRFFRWLHRSSQFDWRKPEDFEDLSVKVNQLASDNARSLEQVATFSLQELVLLMRYGQPMERLLLLLGLNCGFGTAEIATLQVDEVVLHNAHLPRYQEILGYETTDDDSFIKRVRRKNGVYGEFLLFPITTQGLDWALGRRRQQPGFAPNARLLHNENGEPFDKPTRSGNRNQQIPNYFARLIERVKEDGNEINALSFGKLRKTAGDLVRRFSDGEVMAVFHCRGNAVRTDDLADVYSNRPYGKVFGAIKMIQDYLQPVFEAAGSDPFVSQPQAYTPRSVIDSILALHAEGKPREFIANQVEVSVDTVSRHIGRRQG